MRWGRRRSTTDRREGSAECDRSLRRPRWGSPVTCPSTNRVWPSRIRTNACARSQSSVTSTHRSMSITRPVTTKVGQVSTCTESENIHSLLSHRGRATARQSTPFAARGLKPSAAAPILPFRPQKRSRQAPTLEVRVATLGYERGTSRYRRRPDLPHAIATRPFASSHARLQPCVRRPCPQASHFVHRPFKSAVNSSPRRLKLQLLARHQQANQSRASVSVRPSVRYRFASWILSSVYTARFA